MCKSMLQDGEPPASLQTSGSGSAPAPKKAGGKGGKAAAGGGAVELDREWVVEHAVQVASMLPGGERTVEGRGRGGGGGACLRTLLLFAMHGA